MTSVEIPYSIAAALPTLAVLDITNEVAHEVARSEIESGIAFVSASSDPSLVRVNERESGLFRDLESLLERLVPCEARERERLLVWLLGPRTEQVPVAGGRLCLGTYQRVFLVGFGEAFAGDWTVTLLG
ncbi:MAG: YjbQ family protein [Actinobacteria bacterium]|nr:YjbQ family protein [Actinomycetota bacterium]